MTLRRLFSKSSKLSTKTLFKKRNPPPKVAGSKASSNKSTTASEYFSKPNLIGSMQAKKSFRISTPKNMQSLNSLMKKLSPKSLTTLLWTWSPKKAPVPDWTNLSQKPSGYLTKKKKLSMTRTRKEARHLLQRRTKRKELRREKWRK